MTFRSLALSNIRGNWRSYAAFFLSSVFSVFIFYLYASFVMHPDVVGGKIVQAKHVVTMMEICMYVIVIFSFFFVLYCSSAFVKTRKKEFGLLTLFGTTRHQLRKMVVYESMAVAVLSTAIGLGLGILLSKLFIMSLGVLLNSEAPIQFAIPIKALWMTAGGFLLLFLFISLLTAMRVGRTEIVELLSEGRKPKKPPAFSLLLSALAALTLTAGYLMAAITTIQTFTLLTLPIIGLTIIGTYFLYTQLSVAIIRLLQRRKSFYYRRTNMLIVSQLAFRMKDNSRILFVVTVLSAIVMSAASTVYVFQKVQRDQILEQTPYTVGYIEAGEGHPVMDPAKAEALLTQGETRIAEKAVVQGLHVEQVVAKAAGWDKANPGQAMLMSLSDYNRFAARMGLPKRELQATGNQSDTGTGFLVPPYRYVPGMDNGEGSLAEGVIGGKTLRLKLTATAFSSVISQEAQASWLLVIPDIQMDMWKKDALSSAELRFYGFELEQWEDQQAAVTRFKGAVPEQQLKQVQDYRITYYKDMVQAIGLTVFIGLFISGLFFIASGSLLYFKLFTELQEDRNQFRALKRIGLTAGELRRIVAIQVGVIYLVPCLVGIVHSLFAMLALGTLLMQPVWMYGLIIMGIYILMQTVYCLISLTMYSRSILRDAAV
ncbi:putative ABC transport system permease protein [Paenibacillaceae bacterium GAS479]|nr:putative ABC transport system permease protein [Paenibacillaceae bacterium GAS479]